MFYDTSNKHNLPHNPFKSCVVPRPIGWISSMDQNGVTNLAPYSYFNAISDIPPMVMFASSFNATHANKDTISNIQKTCEFVVNIATFKLKELMQLSSTPLPYGVSEIEEFHIPTEASTLVKPPRVKDSPISLECRYIKTIDLDFNDQNGVFMPATSQVVIGHVIGIHISNDVLTDGKIDIGKLEPIARLGYNQYAKIVEVFTMKKI